MDVIININHQLIIIAILSFSTLFSCSIIDPSQIRGDRMNQGGDNVASRGSWKDWARDKFVEGLGHRHENSKIAVMDVAGDIAKKTKEKVSDVASGAEISNHKAEEAKDVLKKISEDAKQTRRNNGQETGHGMKNKAADHEIATEKLARAAREMRAKLKQKVAEL